MDNCKKCGHHLIKYPNYFQGKIKYQYCMGNIEYQTWEANKKIKHEIYLQYQKQKELENRVYFPRPFSSEYYSKKNRVIRFLKSVIRKLR